MIKANVQTLLNYQDSRGRKAAMLHYNWARLTAVEESMYADEILALAKSIDGIR